ncbi:efflux RND transporter permease subunit [Altererythrobacter sp. CC-YST694]|uniref:efflux RND transporter permease subunit n=1 Tax=Altererythrobacter sp. CC-YST694 TaxID=2755038 RepID=UPI001D0256BF|nr:efflux RND transporter permease subunit [Altererythrobacter sp. CC-YST694]MCB5423789.1 efflux RND transporter permease subunit [Altererythrobacter sp. CC-YST694]
MSRIFIDRPIFAWVLAIIVMMAGIGSLTALPIEQYPDIAPTTVNVRASYPGASAETVENSVTQILEQQLTGIDGLLYFSSDSSSRGQSNITATFVKGTDPDIAQVQVQNKIQAAISRLPADVQQQGVRVTKSNSDTLLLVAVYDETDTRSYQDVSDYLSSNIQDTLSRVDGVGDVNVFGSPHAMRIWLDPIKLAAFQLMPGDVINALRSQNTEIAAGEVGGLPSPQGQLLNATVTAQSRLQTPDQFRNIVLKTLPSGSSVKIKDVARVEIGAENYNILLRMNGHPGAGMAIQLSPGSDALRTADLVKAKMDELGANLPDGLAYAYANDSTNFIRLSVSEVQVALLEAIGLVVIVMFVFLQSWRALLVPVIAVPVVMLGTMAVFYLAGFSLNTLTLFGLVLAIGLLVDDAIVVVENVERLLEENPGMSPREATIQSMDELQIALIAIALVLSAVFLPMAFFGGSTGVIYRQFSVTIISCMVLSVLVALILSPAITASVLKQKHRRDEDKEFHRHYGRFARVENALEGAKVWFNRNFDRMVGRYLKAVEAVVDRKWRFLGLYGVILAVLAALFVHLPGGFLPNEDQGRIMVQFRLPPGATQVRTIELRDMVEKYLAENEKANVSTQFLVAGGGGGGQNSGQGFINLKHWDERPGPENTADAIAQRATMAFSGLRDGQVFFMVPGSVRGLGDSAGFNMNLQNITGMSRDQFVAARDKLVEMAQKSPLLTQVRSSELPDNATLKVDLDTQRLTAYGINSSDVNTTLSTAWGGRYVNDFIENGRVKRVYVQGEPEYRATPEDLSQWYVRAGDGSMAPFSAFSKIGWATTPNSTGRFQGVPSFGITGQAAPGVSSGEAMAEMERLAAEIPGTAVGWTGSSYEERQSSGQAPLLYALSVLVVFLCLAALYESWSIPVAVLLVIPLGLVGALFAATLRGLENDVFLQIGLLTTMGLASKNAILMIEFAEQEEKKGKRIIEAVLAAARLRLRPILMTSFAFIFGVLPLAISTGAGANSRIAIGTSVIGGMLTASILAIFYIPLLFVLVRRSTRDGMKAARERFNRFRRNREAQA